MNKLSKFYCCKNPNLSVVFARDVLTIFIGGSCFVIVLDRKSKKKVMFAKNFKDVSMITDKT